jgi:threonyl-tRNA synthetase
MQLNDGHIFCAAEDVASEAAAALAMIRQAYRDLGIEAARFRLSLAGPAAKYAGSQHIWDQATAVLTEVLTTSGVDFEAEHGEAAFYGPKIDVQVADSAEREISLSTIQVDFYQPERFGLVYTGPDGARHRPVMVHRSIVGSIERAIAHLIDTHGGAFPAWLAPVQLAILPITDAQLPYAAALAREAVAAGLRAEMSAPEDGSLGARIRAARLVPYQAIIGQAEAAAGQVAIRLRDGRKLPAMAAREALARIAGVISARDASLWPVGAG